MPKIFSHLFLKLGLTFCVAALLPLGQASAQGAPAESDMYCAGMATTEAMPDDTYVISGENSAYLSTFTQNQLVFINRGADQGVKVGDQYEVVRAVHEPLKYKWFEWQPQLTLAMGTLYADIGRLEVVNVQAKTSTARVTMSCIMMQRGDLARPMAPRPAPPYHSAGFDHFAPPSGKNTAMVVVSKNFGQINGAGNTVYVNLGTAQGVKVGDYFRVFRYQGTRTESAYQPRNTSYQLYGYGSPPVAYRWNDLPRQVLGEGIVLRAGPNSSTVLLTLANQEIYVGDYVELE